VYESRPRNVIITLDRQLYRIPEVALPNVISLICVKQCSTIISQTRKFVFFLIHAHTKQKVTATSMTFTQSLSLQQKQVDRIVEEYRDIFSSPTRVPTHCPVKHLIDLTPGTPFPNELDYRRSLKSSVRSKRCFKGAHQTQLLPLQNPNFTGIEERQDLVALH
jgi:hypothetical protein